MKREPQARTQLAFDFDSWQSGAPEAAESEKAREANTCPGYGLGHPWHYLERGCGGIPIRVEQILPPSPSPQDAPHKLPAKAVERASRLRALYQEEQRGLDDCKAQYEEILDEGVEALSWYDREIAHGGDLELAWACSIALAYNHVVSCLGRLAWLRRELGLDPGE